MSEPICIRRTSTMEEAEILVAWLADNGLTAHVVDRANPGVFAFGMTDLEGIAVFVADAESADRARTLLEEHDRAAAARWANAKPIGVSCEECGAANEYPARLAGSVQECASCHAYLDVPGGAEFTEEH